MFNKKSQTGETLTWVVATVVILFILLVTIFLASVLNQNKNVEKNLNEDSIATKSFFSYLLTKNTDGKIVYEKLKEAGAFYYQMGIESIALAFSMLGMKTIFLPIDFDNRTANGLKLKLLSNSLYSFLNNSKFRLRILSKSLIFAFLKIKLLFMCYIAEIIKIFTSAIKFLLF